MNLFSKLMYTRELSYTSVDGQKVTISTDISSKGEKRQKISIGNVFTVEKINDNETICNGVDIADVKYRQEVNRAYAFAYIADSGQRYIPSIPNQQYKYLIRLAAYDSANNIYMYSCINEYSQPQKQSSLLLNSQENYQINQDFITTNLSPNNKITTTYSLLDKTGKCTMPHEVLTINNEIARIGNNILTNSARLQAILKVHQYNIQDYVVQYNKKTPSR